MFQFLLTLCEVFTVATWCASTIHIAIYLIDKKAVPDPWPLTKAHTESRFERYLKIYAYAPACVVLYSWVLFKESTPGKRIIAFFKENV